MYKDAHDAFLDWKTRGKPIEGPLLDKMKITRSNFRLALKRCKANEESRKNESLAQDLLSKNYIDFWKSVKNTKKYLHTS